MQLDQCRDDSGAQIERRHVQLNSPRLIVGDLRIGRHEDAASVWAGRKEMGGMLVKVIGEGRNCRRSPGCSLEQDGVEEWTAVEDS